MREQFGSNGLTVIAVSAAPADEVRKFARELGASYPIIADGNEMFMAFGVRGVPDAFLIDREGRIVAEGLDGIEEWLMKELGG